MKRSVLVAGTLAFVAVIASSQEQSTREINREALRDKIAGG